MAKKFKKKPEEGQPLWLLSYSDLVTQLLVFFVMLYAVSADMLDTQRDPAPAFGLFRASGAWRAARRCRPASWPAWATP